MEHTYKTIIGDMKKLIQLKGKDELNDQENSELEKLLENEKIYKPYLDLLKKKAVTEKKKRGDEEKYIEFIQSIKLKSSDDNEEFNKLLNNTMSNLPENLKIIATKNSTGWIDASTRLQNSSRNDIELIEGSTEHEDLQKLLNGEVDGLMRGHNYAITLTRKNDTLGFLPAWNIIENVVPAYGMKSIPTETFEITSIENELTHFMNVRLIRLSLIGYITDLKQKFSLP
jgi:hypothetical protein